MKVRRDTARRRVPREEYLVGDKSVWPMAYAGGKDSLSLFRTIRYWLYAIYSFLRTNDALRTRAAYPRLQQKLHE